MKTRLKHIPETKKTNQISPILKFAFFAVIFFAIFGGFIANYSMDLYILMLIMGFPIIMIFGVLIKNFLKPPLTKSTLYIIGLFILFLLLILYIITFWNIFLYILVAFAGLAAFINYIPYLQLKHSQRIAFLKKQSKYKVLFKNYLTNKNFLNNHNYYPSRNNKDIYINKLKKQRLGTMFRMSVGLPLILTLFAITEGSFESLNSGLGFYIFCVIILGVLFALKLVYDILFGILRYKSKNGYQAKIKNTTFLKYKGKYFFY